MDNGNNDRDVVLKRPTNFQAPAILSAASSSTLKNKLFGQIFCIAGVVRNRHSSNTYLFKRFSNFLTSKKTKKSGKNAKKKYVSVV